MFPFLSNPDDPDDEDVASHLPDGVTEETVNDLIRRLVEEMGLLGLYADPQIRVEIAPSPEVDGKDRIIVNAVFRIGKVAFTKRVLNPEQDKTDTAFSAIEDAETEAHAEDIITRFSRHENDPDT